MLLASGVLAVHNEQDITAPVVVWLTVEPLFIDTSEAIQTITVTARITDDLSGHWQTEARYQSVVAPGQIANAIFRESERISGDANDGIYQDTIEMPRYSAYGKWRLETMYRADILNNFSFVYETANIQTEFYNGPPAYLPNSVYLPVVGR